MARANSDGKVIVKAGQEDDDHGLSVDLVGQS